MILIPRPFLYGWIISLLHFSPGKRKAYLRFFPVPLSTEHSSLQITFSYCSLVHNSLSLYQARRIAATSGVSSGRFLASQLVSPYTLSSRYMVDRLAETPAFSESSEYAIRGCNRASRMRCLLSWSDNTFGRPERYLDTPSLRWELRKRVDLVVLIGILVSRFIWGGILPALSCLRIIPLWNGVRLGFLIRFLDVSASGLRSIV